MGITAPYIILTTRSNIIGPYRIGLGDKHITHLASRQPLTSLAEIRKTVGQHAEGTGLEIAPAIFWVKHGHLPAEISALIEKDLAEDLSKFCQLIGFTTNLYRANPNPITGFPPDPARATWVSATGFPVTGAAREPNHAISYSFSQEQLGEFLPDNLISFTGAMIVVNLDCVKDTEKCSRIIRSFTELHKDYQERMAPSALKILN